MKNIKFIIGELTYDVHGEKFSNNISTTDVVRYLKGIHTNKTRFKTRFTDNIEEICEKHPIFSNVKGLITEMLGLYSKVKPFSYAEAFAIKDEQFKAVVFGSVNINEMIDSLGSKRIKTDGIKLNHKQFTLDGELNGYKEYDNIYEVYEVDGNKLGLDEKLYVIKCWCTSTNKEHWLWIDGKHKDDPLSAIAATFMIHENLIPNIKEIKRQGDVLLVEMKEDIMPEGNIVSLTKEQYFGLLTCQS